MEKLVLKRQKSKGGFMKPPKTFLGKPPTLQHEQVAKELEAKEEAERDAQVLSKDSIDSIVDDATEDIKKRIVG